MASELSIAAIASAPVLKHDAGVDRYTLTAPRSWTTPTYGSRLIGFFNIKFHVHWLREQHRPHAAGVPLNHHRAPLIRSFRPGQPDTLHRICDLPLVRRVRCLRKQLIA